MDFVRVRHPDTGQETRVAAYQYERHLAAKGFTIVDEAAPEVDETPLGTGDDDDSPDLLSLDGITPEIAEALADIGITDRAALAALSDEDLDELPGVGPATVSRIRAALEETSQ